MLNREAKAQIHELSHSISLGEKICIAANEAKSFKVECNDVIKLVNHLSQILKILLRFINSACTPLYLRPVRCVLDEINRHFEFALDILHKSNQRNLLWRFFTTCNANRFHDLHGRLKASIDDAEWLRSIFIETPTEPNEKSAKHIIWSLIAIVKMGFKLEDRIHAAESLASLARRNDEYKKIIYEEDGVPVLQKFFKEKGQISRTIAAETLCLLANENERKIVIMKEMVSTILNRLSRDSSMWDQIEAADMVAGIVERNPEMKEYELIKENVIWRLVSLLSSDDDDGKPGSVKPDLKLSCSRALLMLVKESVPNCTTLAETKGLLSLAKLSKTEKGELQYNCLMIIREITSIAESNDKFRRSTFKSSSPTAKAVVDELLRVIEEFNDVEMSIPAIKSVGSLARSFSVKENRVINPLVARLDDTNREVKTEASIALQKFVCPTNHIRSEHSNSIIEAEAVPLLMKILLDNEDRKLQSHGLKLICYLAIHGSNSDALIKAGALTALQRKYRALVKEQPDLEELVSPAIFKLQSDNTDKNEESVNSQDIKQIITEQCKLVIDFVRRIVNLRRVEGYWRSCKRGISRGIRSSKTRRIRRFVKVKCVDLALTIRSAIEYSRGKVVMKEIARKIRFVMKIVESIEKKEIRRKFGYIVHKVMEFCTM